MYGTSSTRRQFINNQSRSTTLETMAVYKGVVDSPMSYHPLVEKLRVYLAQKGTDGAGFSEMQRRFHAMDRDGTKSVNPEEFRLVLQRLNLNFSDQEFSQLFAFFDCYNNGFIDYEEFILSVRGPMHPRRRQLVSMAWYYIDFNKEGYVDPEEVIGRYDATQHPDVKSGAKSSQDVFRDFLKAFEVGGEMEGKVTRKEFENYYYNVSSSVERDDYFESMMRNVWHLHGQNWPNRRYQVVHPDGRTSVEEIWNDWGGMNNWDEKWDEHSVMARLRSQGLNPVSFSRYEGSDEPFYQPDFYRRSGHGYSGFGGYGYNNYNNYNNWRDGYNNNNNFSGSYNNYNNNNNFNNGGEPYPANYNGSNSFSPRRSSSPRSGSPRNGSPRVSGSPRRFRNDF